MDDENKARQAEEVEVLESIYGEEWCLVDDVNRVYCIRVMDDMHAPKLTVNLQVIMPPDYPANAPPEYQLNAPWLRGEKKYQLGRLLEDTCGANIGESIIFLWVEKIREFLSNITENGGDIAAVSNNPGHRTVTMTEETDHSFEGDSDDSFEITETHTTDILVLPPPVEEVLECPAVLHGEPMTDRRSTFQAHLAAVLYKEQVKMVLDKLLENKKIANATHNIYAYRIVIREEPTPLFQQAGEDDGEIAAGSRMLHLMKIVDARNVMVIVTRWYGGIQLGPDRFKHINNCCRQILEDNGYLREKGEKKGPRSKKGK